MTGGELDVPAVLGATDRLLRALRGPLGGTATWEWGDLLAAATGRSPFDMMGVVRSVDPQVPVPAHAEPRDVAAQLTRLAQALDDQASAERVRQVARVLDPAGGETAPPADAVRPTDGPTPAPVAAQPNPQPSPPQQPPPPQGPPAGAPAPVHSAPTVLPSGAPNPYRSGDGGPASPASRRRAPATPRKRKGFGPWIGIFVLAYFIIRGYTDSTGGG